MATKEEYYKQVIQPLSNEDKVVEFLNQKDIMNKWSEEDREFFIVCYLQKNGWVEVEEEQEAPKKTINKKKK